MRKVLATVMMCGMLFCGSTLTVSASSLDDVVNSQTQEQATQETDNSATSNSSSSTGSDYVTADEFMEQTKQATKLTTDGSEGAAKVNAGISKVASFVVRILSYFLTAMLVVRVVLDLVYISIPFTRSMLSNGYAGNAAAGGPGAGMAGPMGGMGGMGMGGMGMGGMGMRGGYGMNRMGMGGMGGMGMGGMQQGQMGATPAAGRMQLVSSAALNAVAAESMPGPDGRPQNALKLYAKDMAVVLVITPILLTLAITGVLTQLGFLIGDLLARGISSIGQMM